MTCISSVITNIYEPVSEARKEEKTESSVVRTTITLSKRVFSWAESLADENGYANFSAYIAELVRRDKQADDMRKIEMRERLAAIGASTRPGTQEAESTQTTPIKPKLGQN